MKKLTCLCLAVLMLCTCAVGFSSCTKRATLQILETKYIEEDYAIAVKKGNTELLNQINTALSDLIADGTVKKIVDKYISGVEHDLVFQANAADKPVIKMGTNAEFEPYEYKEGETIVGIDAEVAAAIADKLGRRLVIEDMAFNSIIGAIETDKVDFGMAGMTVTEDRLKNVDFTVSYAKGVQVVIVAEGSEITSVDSLFSLKADGSMWKVGVQEGTTGEIYASGDLAECDNPTAEVERYSKGADAVQALATGKIDCVIIDNEPAKAFVAANNK